ncbi:MAG: histidine kinase [Spirosomataceae bacterium]
MKHLLFLLLSWLSLTLKAQNSKQLDSLEHALTAAKPDSQKVLQLVKLANRYRDIDLKKSYHLYQQADSLSTQVHFSKGIVQVCEGYMACYYLEGKYEKSLPFLQRGLHIAQQNHLPKEEAMMLGDIGAWYMYMGNRKTALDYNLKALAINEKVGSKNAIGFNLANSAALFHELKLDDKAIEFNQRTIDLLKGEPDKLTPAQAYGNLGNIFNEQKKHLAARDAYQKAITLCEASDQNYALRFSVEYLDGLGRTYLLLNQPQNAQKTFEIALSRIQFEVGENTEHVGRIQASLAKLYFKSKAFDKAETAALSAIRYTPPSNQAEMLPSIYQLLAQIHLAKGNMAQWEHYQNLTDSLETKQLNQEVRKGLLELETKYRTAQKDKELIEQRSENFRQRTWLIALAVSLLAVVILGYLFYNRYRLRQKAILDAAIINEQQLGLNAVIEAQEAERKRIAKDLHDGIAQELVALKLGFEQLRSNQELPKFNTLMQSLDEACKEIRTISHVMMPPTLTYQGLPSSLEMLLRNSLEQAGIQHQFDNLGITDRLDEKVEIGLYRIAQELLNNIVKHAQANEVVVQLQKIGNNIILRVEDNGLGFDFETAKQKGSMGLLNILSRVRTLGGTFVSEPSTPTGTVSMVRVPI